MSGNSTRRVDGRHTCETWARCDLHTTSRHEVLTGIRGRHTLPTVVRRLQAEHTAWPHDAEAQAAAARADRVQARPRRADLGAPPHRPGHDHLHTRARTTGTMTILLYTHAPMRNCNWPSCIGLCADLVSSRSATPTRASPRSPTRSRSRSRQSSGGTTGRPCA